MPDENQQPAPKDKPVKDLSQQGLQGPDMAPQPTQPLPSEYGGRYRHVGTPGVTGDRFIYELAIRKDAPDGKTHKLRIPPQTHPTAKDDKGNAVVLHPGKYWEADEETFKEHFEKL